jgi:hypothetical protein
VKAKGKSRWSSKSRSAWISCRAVPFIA